MALLDAKAFLRLNSDGDGKDDVVAALHFAVEQGLATFCRKLLVLHADIDIVNAVTSRGWSALMTAACEGDAKFCRLMLDAGADVDAVVAPTGVDHWTDEPGRTAEHIAIQYKRSDAFDAIQSWRTQRDAVAAFASGTTHARYAHKHGHWTDSKLFDINLVAEITAFLITPAAARRRASARRRAAAAALVVTKAAASRSKREKSKRRCFVM
jgi:hypothetical protein